MKPNPHPLPAACARAGRGLARAGAWIGLAAGLCSTAAGSDPGTNSPALRHWAFEPVRSVPLPAVRQPAWVRNGIDAFILAGLEQHGLAPAPEADRLTWLRRVSLDLTGLPPQPDEITGFLGDHRPDAFERVVDRLLESPRHGERAAQHWLDLVRYGDTHGFEVNTERPNAWPYRDYVIRAFNRDLPYDRFIRDQLAGDAWGEEAATGFLVTAPALLPGQIGADDVSKRLARQDALNEIVINTGETFLGLTIGCARCHDHKYNPIPQRDYYAVQAFFAGVEYGDRVLDSPGRRERQRQAEVVRSELAVMEAGLSRFEPPARPGAPPARVTNARLNEEVFPPTRARFVRFAIHDANLHPTLGLIEPCIDEFEILTSGEAPRNVALATTGTRVTASGSRVSERHRLEHINDGRYGNSRSWMSDEAGQGWVLFELPEPVEIARIRWSRDRDGELADRLPTAYTIEAGLTTNALSRLVDVPPPRPMVSALRSTDRFAPTAARRLRFTVLACTSLEPCLDELEVFTTGDGATNAAVASHGTRVTASGTLSGSPLHRLEHLNDGLPGNAHSWISSTSGTGWVELEFARMETIDRVVWSRDREGKFADRLPTEYRIEVAGDDGAWRTVADSSDRRKYSPEEKPAPRPSLAGLPPEEAREAGRLRETRRGLEVKLAALTNEPTVFAGVSREPDVTRVLHRGDPEQPRAEVIPAGLSALGAWSLPATATDTARRQALAAWIASPTNPLTARVMVNRVWQDHFGTGLVPTPNDFGPNGAKPSHPGLLDWLAADFIRSGWSLKRLHRRIVTSATYRQSGRIQPEAAAVDADCRWLWRFPSRRLEAEAIRDSMLAVDGRLNLAMGGPGFNFFKSRGGLDGFPPLETFEPAGLRRMIYSHKVRREGDLVFGAFDCPDAGQSTPRRSQSTTPLQALNLFNSRFTIDQSTAFAARVDAVVGRDAPAADRAALACRLAWGRNPGPAELADLEAVVRVHGLPVLCRALFNSNEFLFLP